MAYSGSGRTLRRSCPGPFRIEGRTKRRSEEHTSELQSQSNLVCRLLLEKKKKTFIPRIRVMVPTPNRTRVAEHTKTCVLNHTYPSLRRTNARIKTVQ